jgi:hypothetical protein
MMRKNDFYRSGLQTDLLAIGSNHFSKKIGIRETGLFTVAWTWTTRPARQHGSTVNRQLAASNGLPNAVWSELIM